MDMLKTVREIGFFETGNNLVEVLSSADVQAKAGEVMPLPGKELTENTSRIADWLAAFGKHKYMLFTPEIHLIDYLAKNGAENEAIILVPCDMEKEIKDRLSVNLPKGMRVSLLEEPYFPEEFYPGNGLVVACGYMAGGRLMVLPETYRMIDHYSGFLGKKVFVPYVELEDAVRYEGWMEVSRDRFNTVWRTE